jgi:hypothetical protein
MTHAFGAFGRVDFVNFFAQINGLIGAFGLTHITVDAFVGDRQCHGLGSAKGCIGFMPELSTTQISLQQRKAVPHRCQHLEQAPTMRCAGSAKA